MKRKRKCREKDSDISLCKGICRQSFNVAFCYLGAMPVRTGSGRDEDKTTRHEPIQYLTPTAPTPHHTDSAGDDRRAGGTAGHHCGRTADRLSATQAISARGKLSSPADRRSPCGGQSPPALYVWTRPLCCDARCY